MESVRRPRRPAALSKNEGTTIAVLGAKGGVGTTSVALNLGCALGRQNTVILAELQPTLGTLWQYFRPQQNIHSCEHLFQADPALITASALEHSLWRYKSVPGVHVLFGPRNVMPSDQLNSECLRAMLKVSSTLARYVILDLPPTLSTANHSALECSDFLVLVVERDPFSVEAGKRFLETIRSWRLQPSQIGAVVVNQAALAFPMDIAELENLLGAPVLGVIPPAPDLCVTSQKTGTPVVLQEPDSLVGLAITSLADRLTSGLRG